MRGEAAKIFLELVCLLLCRAEDGIIAQWLRQPAQYGYCPNRRKLQPIMSNTCKEKSCPDQKSNPKTKEEDNGWTGHMAWTRKSVRYTGRRQR
ncbi:hypothetical protein PoB_005127200 [Plakobranchus ocellatus]|uniref:Secreted protein n=1 Tax=Plakobranchus ocellatus TaxID=259542 RepID=A0AAV4C0F6_9GAST|nr:hypothetical protein PoB_005127200 [Plakobranchus ocellatus]